MTSDNKLKVLRTIKKDLKEINAKCRVITIGVIILIILNLLQMWR
mgnify:CR=1 FL=1